MNRETIEKAADDYALGTVQMDVEWGGRIDRSMCSVSKSSFVAGADWRIKHVWHDVQKELPAPDKTVIAEYIIDGERDYCFTHRSESPRVSVDKHGFCFYIRGAEIIRWAYLEDLLPDRKEVQP